MDARVVFGPSGGDVALEAGDLAADEGLVTGVVLSLLSDGRAPGSDEAPELSQDLRGYWGEDPADPYGSLLWTLGRSKATRETLARARELVEGSLAWLKASGIASAVEVTAAYGPGGVLAIDVRLVRGPSRRWASLWSATLDQSLSAGGLLLSVQTG